MQITTDPDTHVVYIKLTSEDVARTVTESHNPIINVDYDEWSKPVGIEILPIWEDSRSDLS